jgi:hypothetical protein
MENAVTESGTQTEPSAAPIPDSTGRVETETYPLFSDSEDSGPQISNENLHEVNVFGEKKNVPIDELIKVYQKNEASDKKFREADERTKDYTSIKSENEELKKSTEQLLHQLKTDPFGVLQHKSLGLDLDQLLYDKMNEKMEYEEMDEYERENLDLRRRVEAYEAHENKAKEERTLSDSQSKQKQYASNIANALKEAGITPTADTIRVAAGHLHSSTEKTGYPTITWAEMVDRTKGSLKEEAQKVYGQLPPEQLAEYLGEDAVSRIRKHDIQKVKNNFKLNQPDVQAEDVVRRPKRQMSKDEFRERMLKIKSSLA